METVCAQACGASADDGGTVMARALDPYHRIRAGVAAIFLLSVLVMAVATMHGPVRPATVPRAVR